MASSTKPAIDHGYSMKVRKPVYKCTPKCGTVIPRHFLIERRQELGNECTIAQSIRDFWRLSLHFFGEPAESSPESYQCFL
jgi:hypothetical protein